MTVDTPARDASSDKTPPRPRRVKSPTSASNGAAGADEQMLEELLGALTALRDGDFSVRLGRRDGVVGQLVERINEVAALQERRNRELVRVSRVIGREGRMTERLD